MITAHRNHFNYKCSLNTDDQQWWPYGLNFDRNFYWILNELVGFGTMFSYELKEIVPKFGGTNLFPIWTKGKTRLRYAVYVCYSRNN